MNIRFCLPYAEIRLIYKEKLPENTVYLKQIHSSDILIINNLPFQKEEGDGLLTEVKDVYLGVKTADCLAVAFLNIKRIGIIHVGWRGVKKGIVEKMSEYFKGHEDTYIFISPSARSCCYEVGEEFLDYFKRNMDFRNKKLFFDLKKEVRERLNKLGFEKFIDYNVCTICNSKFPSHRRDGTKERMFTLVKLL